MSPYAPTPLEDPVYVPAHPPVNGRPPDVVAKWGPRSQLRWFTRFQGQLTALPRSQWARFFCASDEHRGMCCVSCVADQEEGYYDIEDHCCCFGLRESTAK